MDLFYSFKMIFSLISLLFYIFVMFILIFAFYTIELIKLFVWNMEYFELGLNSYMMIYVKLFSNFLLSKTFILFIIDFPILFIFAG